MIGQTRAMLAALALGLALTGCGQGPPTGQVLATVDGDEITRRDLATEMRATGLAADAPRGAGKAALERIVARNLLVRDARRQGLDRSPDYLAAVQRIRETVLASMVAEQIAADLPMPSTADITTYVDQHPYRFAKRQLFLLDTLSSATRIDAADLAAAPDLDGLAARLSARGQPFSRARASLDSFALSPELANRLAAAAPRTVVTLPASGGSRVGVVVEHRSLSVSAAESNRIAAALMRDEALSAALAARISGERDAAAIKFQRGFGPGSPD